MRVEPSAKWDETRHSTWKMGRSMVDPWRLERTLIVSRTGGTHLRGHPLHWTEAMVDGGTGAVAIVSSNV